MMILIIPMKNLLMKIKVCKAFEELFHDWETSARLREFSSFEGLVFMFYFFASSWGIIHYLG